MRCDVAGHITHVSENCTALLGRTPEQILTAEAPLPGSMAFLADLPDKPGKYRIATVQIDTHPLEARAVRDHNGGILIELASALPDAEPPSLHALRRPLICAPTSKRGIALYESALLDAIEAITGFDHIMIYRFHEDWSGEVIRERHAATSPSYLGLRFPAGDIPAIARQLYSINPWRHIHDVLAPPVAIRSADNEPLDLTYTDLRSVSPVHLAYLGNMGVGASLSIPLKIFGQLWGLIACHHRTARYLSQARRDAAASVAQTFCITAASILTEEKMQFIDRVDLDNKALLHTMPRSGESLDNIALIGDQLRQALDASGLWVTDGNKSICMSGTLPEAGLLSSIDQFFIDADKGLFFTDHLSEWIPTSHDDTAVASGLLAMTIKLSPKQVLRFYWLRGEEAYEVNWAGNPYKQEIASGASHLLTPRRSFEKWVEKRTGYSKPWENTTRLRAAKLRDQLPFALRA